VTVVDRGDEVGRTTANRRGEWVLVPPEPLPPGDRELSLSASCGDAPTLNSDRVVVVVVPEPSVEVAGREDEAPAQPLALAVPREGAGTTTVLQMPAPAGETQGAAATAVGSAAAGAVVAATGDVDQLTLDVIDYGSSGHLALSGSAPAGERVQVYIDNSLLGSAKSGDDGRWSLVPERDVPPGLYQLRVDQVRPDGSVVARVELPFLRGEPLTDLPDGRLVVVQPGNSLWRIARRTYGTGIQFAVIYDANKDQIRDPDLIYPGQVFTLPRVN